MPKRIRFEGKEYDFPDDASDDEILGILSQEKAQAPKQPEARPGFLQRAYDSSIGGALEMGREIFRAAKEKGVQAVPDEIINPLAKAMGQKYDELNQKTGSGLFQRANNFVNAMGETMVGPVRDQIKGDLQAGNYGGAAGTLLGTAATFALPAIFKGKKPLKVAPFENPNAVEAAAADFLMDEGVRVPAGAASGSTSLKMATKLSDSTLGGAIAADAEKGALTGDLKRVARKLEDRASPMPQTPESAGQGLKDALSRKIALEEESAQAAYGDFNRAAASPKNTREVPTGKQTVDGNLIDPSTGKPVPMEIPVMESMQIPVDVRPIKAWAREVLEPLKQRWAAADPEAAKVFNQQIKSLESIANGKDFKDAVIAEKDLSNLKALVRNTDPATESSMRGTQAMEALQKTIDDTVKAQDPEAYWALQEGRELWRKKSETAESLRLMRDEPVQAFGQATWANDSGIDRLRTLQKEVPGEMPKVGRAFIEDLFTKAEAAGGFDKAVSMNSAWQRLGPETKKVLFPDAALRTDLDKFFLGVQKIAENPNPSGTALLGTAGVSGGMILTNPLTGVPLNIGAYAMSRMMRNPQAVRALTKGLEVNVADKARAAFQYQKILASLNQVTKDSRNRAKGTTTPALATQPQ